jgi:hypothetical protein
MPHHVPSTVDERKGRSSCSNEYVTLAAPARGSCGRRIENVTTGPLAEIRGQ